MPTFSARSTPIPSPTDTRPNSPTSSLLRHPNCYLPGGDLFIQIDDTLFRIPSFENRLDGSIFSETWIEDEPHTLPSSYLTNSILFLLLPHELLPYSSGYFTTHITTFSIFQSKHGGILKSTPHIGKCKMFWILSIENFIA